MLAFAQHSVIAASSLSSAEIQSAVDEAAKEYLQITMQIDRIDHLVLTVRDVEATCSFYARVLQMEAITFADGRWALNFGHQKLNLHPAEAPISPHASSPTPGSADLCFITVTPIEQVVAHLQHLSVPIIEGPVRRTGATGPITSVYFRDPDLNLIEVSEYDRNA